MFNPAPNIAATKVNQEPAVHMRTNLQRTPGKQPIGAMHPGHMMPYGPMMYPHLYGMTNPYMMGVGMPGSVPPTETEQSESGKKSVDPRQYITVSIFLLFVYIPLFFIFKAKTC